MKGYVVIIGVLLGVLAALAAWGFMLEERRLEAQSELMVVTTEDLLRPEVVAAGCAAGCSLREAIHVANSSGAPASITLPKRTFKLTLRDEFLISGDITIVGLSRSFTVLDANPRQRPEDPARLFSVQPGARLMLRNLTLRNGWSIDYSGNAIGNGGEMVLNRVVVRDSGCDIDCKGGAIANYGVMTLVDSTVMDNQVGEEARGGGIFNSGHLWVINTSVTSNSAGADSTGGGIYNSGFLTLVNSTVSGNSAPQSPDVYSASSFTEVRNRYD